MQATIIYYKLNTSNADLLHRTITLEDPKKFIKVSRQEFMLEKDDIILGIIFGEDLMPWTLHTMLDKNLIPILINKL